MHPYRWLHRVALLAVTALVAVAAGVPAEAVNQHAVISRSLVTAADSYRILVYSRATGFRHPSTGTGVAAIQQLGLKHGFGVDTTTDPRVFTDAALAPYATVVFVSTTGNPVPTSGERAAFRRYIEGGGGFVGIHAASDGSWSWPWYGRLVGASFSKHPKVQLALVHVEDHASAATSGLADRYRLDEWYDFRTNPRQDVHVLMDVDDATYTGSAMGADHPVTWCQDFDGGRSFYTAMGHTALSYSEPFFLHLLLGGIESTAGAEPDDCSTP